ncbi:LysR family transcriptional regulator [Roseateles amylovorans]|uniref:LysR family transcriptional regulator n=1 Tax=Roseateles amylovorans TaxID=2978473 RepID=A0ABY6B453_9BURK|nr:LysR family transcriptional regulator [Roseateles amylovorans]UXH80161.1 LysR family transcriptional regulator [Roseateles amylovorans]
MDRLTAARVFVEVAERGSLTQTAEHLEMSTAMVSRYLSAAEDWLGARLLHRTTRKVSLTEAGAAALPSCRQLLDVATDAAHLAAERGREPAGLLRITSSSSFAEAELTAALVDFQRQYAQVELVLSVSDKASDLVGERVDLAVRLTNTLDPTMITRPLAKCRSMLCASPAYLALRGQPRTAEDLRQHRCIAHAFGIGKQYRFTRGDETVEVPVSWSFHTNETAVLRRAVLSGAGIGMLPTYYLGDDLSTGRLVRLLPDHEPGVLGIHAIYLSRKHQPLALRLLVDFLAARFAGDPAPWDRAIEARQTAARRGFKS